MEEEIVDLTTPPKEEPWCSACADFTDYKRKWTAYPRADLDGGTYPENEEVPHCIRCDSVMHYLSLSTQLVWGFRFAGTTIFIIATLLCFFLFDFSPGSVTWWIAGMMVAILVTKAPKRSRKALLSHALYMEKIKLMKPEKKL